MISAQMLTNVQFSSQQVPTFLLLLDPLSISQQLLLNSFSNNFKPSLFMLGLQSALIQVYSTELCGINNRELWILRRGRLRARDFLNTEFWLRVNQRHFGGKTRQPSSFYYEFQRECRSGGDKLLHVSKIQLVVYYQCCVLIG